MNSSQCRGLIFLHFFVEKFQSDSYPISWFIVSICSVNDMFDGNVAVLVEFQLFSPLTCGTVTGRIADKCFNRFSKTMDGTFH